MWKPKWARALVDEVRAIRAAPAELAKIETLLHESRERHFERSQERWVAATPDARLTWGREISGDAFVRKAADNGAFGPERTILEVGPGYGRLLESALRLGVPFRQWVGVDLSERNVAHLRERFPDQRFICADAAEYEAGPYDTLLSSLTLKHVYPSCEPILRNLSPDLAVIDLIEGQRRYFQHDGQTFIRWYSREEVEAILARCGMTARFDHVQHDPDHRRLLVVGTSDVPSDRRPDGSAGEAEGAISPHRPRLRPASRAD